MRDLNYAIVIGALVVVASLLLGLVFLFAQHFGSLPRESSRRIAASAIITIGIPVIIVAQMLVEGEIRGHYYGRGPALSFAAVRIEAIIGGVFMLYVLIRHLRTKR